MAGNTELILIIAVGAAIFLFKDQISDAIGNLGGGASTDNSGTQPDQSAQQQQMAQMNQNTYGGATAIATGYPYPIAAAPLNYNLLPYPYPVYAPQPYPYFPFFPRRHFPRPGPRFLGPPVRPPVIGHFAAPRRFN